MTAPQFTDEQRQRHANELKNNYLLNEAFEKVTAAYVFAFRQCHQNDDRGRARYQDALNDLDAVKAHLLAVIAHGELEAKRAAEFQTDTIAKRITRIF